MLAQVQFQLLVSGSVEPREVAPRAESAARKAIELDNTLAIAHRTFLTEEQKRDILYHNAVRFLRLEQEPA